jgi:hypothetical protein
MNALQRNAMPANAFLPNNNVSRYQILIRFWQRYPKSTDAGAELPTIGDVYTADPVGLMHKGACSENRRHYCTANVTVVVCVRLPLVPVIVSV